MPRARTPTARSASPATTTKSTRRATSPARSASPKVKPLVPAPTSRPLYFSDGDTRPTYRGALYSWIRRTGLAWFVLGTYTGFTFVDVLHTPPLLVLCRLFHACAMVFNVVLSDDLHNLDQHLGRDRYVAQHAKLLEQRLHAHDWRAALTVPASYHLLLVLGIMEPARVFFEDKALLGVNLALYALMCMRITPERITPRRELFLSFVATFGVQMLLLLAAFYRERDHHPLWLPLWGVYAVGLLAKALELPTNDVFGHHEVLHTSCIIGHALGLLIDATTT